MKITLDNYATAAAKCDVSMLSPQQKVIHDNLLEFGREVIDGDAASERQAAKLIELLNGQSGGAQAAPKKAPAPRNKPADQAPAADKPATAAKKTTGTRKPAAAKPTPAGGNVRNVTVAVSLIRSFMQMVGKKVPVSRIESKLRAVQAAMLNGSVSKSTPHAKDVDTVQDYLIKALKHVGGAQKTTEFTMEMSDEATKAKLVGIAGGEKVFESVAVLRAFVRLSNKVATKTQLDNLLKRLASPKIKDGDPFQEELKAVHAALKAAKPDKVLAPTQVGLSGTQKSALSGLGALLRTVDRHVSASRTVRAKNAVATVAAKKKPLRRRVVKRQTK